MDRLHRIIRELADRQMRAEREALREYRRGDIMQAHYWDGEAEAYRESVLELNRLIAELNREA